jgi:phage terminase large subunit
LLETVKFVPRLFNPLFFHVNKYLKDDSIRRILVYGSSSAAKTYSICQNIVIDGGIERKYSTLMFRKESANIKYTIKNDVSEIIDNILKISPLDTIYKKLEFEFRTIFGNSIQMRGLDSSGKIKGLKGYKKVYLDELDQFTFDDWKELNRRLRGDTNQQIIASWNPVNENHWIKKNFIDKISWTDLPKIVDDNPYSQLDENSFVRISEDGRTILIKTVYSDNKWVVGGNINGKEYGRVDNQVIADFDEMKEIYPYDYQVYGLGEWGVIRPEQPYLNNYDDDIHFPNQSFEILPDVPTWLSFDFNHNPATGGLYQVVKGLGVIRVREYTQNGGTRMLCQKIKMDPDFENVDKLLLSITGDSSGNSYTSTGGDVNDYDVIKEELEVGDYQLVNTGGVNARHVYSRRVNDEFLYRVPFYMDKSCTELRKDMQMAKEDDHGKLYKDRAKGYSMDHMDNHRYFIHALCPKGSESIKLLREMLR